MKKEIYDVNAFSRCAVRKILHDMFLFISNYTLQQLSVRSDGGER